MQRPNIFWGMITMMFATLAFPQVGHAVVDMKNANYSDSWMDLQFTGTGYALKVQRFYNSRSTFSGIFGFGWCSEFESNIEITPEGRLSLLECGAGQETVYSPSKYDAKAQTKLIDELVAHYRKSTPGATDQGANTLREQLAQSTELRAEWAKHAGLPTPDAKKGTVYTADNLEVDKILFDGTSYTRSLADGTSQKFNSSGHLTMIADKNGNNLKFTYKGDTLSEVIDNTGKKLTFTFAQNKRVKEITGPGGAKAEYKFKGEDLLEVKNMWKNKYTYDYDETHNLTKINFPDGTFKALTYNQKMDWVTSFTDRAVGGPACVETYKYEFSKSDPKNNFWSTALKKCGNEVKNDARFEFWHKTAADGRKYLSRVLTKTLTNSLDVTYHPTLGRPTLVKKDGITTSFDYYQNGLVREKTTPNMRLTFEYKNDFNKVSKVATDFIDAKGKIVRKRSTDFTYDSKANLVAAQNTDGQSVKLTYDAKGRIATILDQAKKEVKVTWDDKSGKPAQITRPGVGTIKMTYKPSGDINKVDSPDGPTVASQIAVTFNNLLDIIAPATSELNL
jgi:YD repeat-containing protein